MTTPTHHSCAGCQGAPDTAIPLGTYLPRRSMWFGGLSPHGRGFAHTDAGTHTHAHSSSSSSSGQGDLRDTVNVTTTLQRFHAHVTMQPKQYTPVLLPAHHTMQHTHTSALYPAHRAMQPTQFTPWVYSLRTTPCSPRSLHKKIGRWAPWPLICRSSCVYGVARLSLFAAFRSPPPLSLSLAWQACLSFLQTARP